MTTDRRFSAEGLAGLVRFTDADPVLSVVQAVLVGWQLSKQTTDATADIVLAVDGGGGRWRVTGITLEAEMRFDDPVAAACCIVAHLLQARMRVEQDFLCLHAAAVDLGGGLVVMPSCYRAGKSALTATLAAAGRRVFSDDVVLIDPATGEAAAPGMAVRLRLPLPERLDPATRAFVDAHAGPRGAHYCYLAPPETALAHLGERAPVRGFVLLDRHEEGPAELTRIAPGAMLRQLIWQNFARAGLPERILETLAALVAQTDCLQLRYSDLAEARDLLLSHFAGGHQALREGEATRLCPDAAARSGRGGLELRNGDLLSRSGTARRFDRAGEIFLTTAGDASILHLNALASCLWTLLEQPLSYGEVLSTFNAAFPSRGTAELDRDLRAALATFKARDLIEVRGQPAARPRRRRSALAAAALCGAIACAEPAGAIVIGGCEGRDISALLAPATGAEWRGAPKEFASLRIVHGVTLACDGQTCQVDGGLLQAPPPGSNRPAVPAPAALTTQGRAGAGIASLPFGSAPPIQLRDVTGDEAAQLMRVLETRGYRDAAGDLRFVWVDYGRLAGQVNLRARSEIHCAAGKAACTVSTAVLTFVGYSERTPCPQFSAP